MKSIQRTSGPAVQVPLTPPAWWPPAPALRAALRALHVQPVLPGSGEQPAQILQTDPGPQGLITAALEELTPRMFWELPEGVVRFMMMLRQRALDRQEYRRTPEAFDDRTRHIEGLLLQELLRAPRT